MFVTFLQTKDSAVVNVENLRNEIVISTVNCTAWPVLYGVHQLPQLYLTGCNGMKSLEMGSYCSQLTSPQKVFKGTIPKSKHLKSVQAFHLLVNAQGLIFLRFLKPAC